MVHFQSLNDIFAYATAHHGPRPLFGYKRGGAWAWLSYAGFAQQVDALRGGLAQLGVGRGDRVAVIANNRVEWAAVCYAAAGLGAQLVPMYEAQHPEERRYILADCGARVVFAATPEIVAQLAAVRAALPALEHLVLLDGESPGTIAYAALLAQGEASPAPAVSVAPDEIAGFIYTSGTTGAPKGVLLTHQNLASNVSGALAIFPIQPEDRSLSFLPWAHSFGQTAELHTFIAAGASMGIAEDASKIIDNLSEVQPTLLVSVPRIFNRIYDRLNHRLAEAGGLQRWLFRRAMANAAARQEGSSLLIEAQHALFERLVFRSIRARFGGRLRFAISGGAALSPQIASFISNLGITVYEGYGLTETAPVVAANSPGASRLGTVGKPLPGVRVTLDHAATGDREEGEIIVHGPNVMRGYHGLPSENTRVFTGDGGFRTGDIGRIDADGFLSITGRIKEKYKLENGKYVVPSPLEEHLKLAPLVSNVLLYGHNRAYNVALVVPDWEAVRAWARRSGLSDTDADALLLSPALLDAVRQQIDAEADAFKHYERPRRLHLLRDDFTTENGMLTPSLKLKRRVVLARYAQEVEALYRVSES